VHVTTDIMVGLPGDGLDDVKRSLGFVLDNGLFTTLNLYPVSVLPNTLLREQGKKLGIVHQDLPPYYVVSTPDMSPDDIREAFAHAGAITGESYFPVELPLVPGKPALGGGGKLIRRVVIEPGRGQEAIDPATIGEALCVEINDPDWPGKGEAIRKRLAPILEANPYTLLSLVVPEECFKPAEILPFVSSLPPRAPHPSDREYMSPRPGPCSTQLFLRSRLEGEGEALTLIPLASDSRPLEVFLPEEAGSAEEDALSLRLEKVLRERRGLNFRDLPSEKEGRDDILPGTAFLDI
jgi:hypothetical protein